MFSENQKKFIYLILVLLLALSVFLLLGGKGVKRKPEQGSEKPTESTPSKVNIELMNQGKLPPALPTDLPLEEGAPPQRNEILKTKDGSETQNVYRYFSKKTVKENYDIYLAYLKNAGWEILGSSIEENSAVMGAKKAGLSGTMQVSISKNNITNDVSVEVNLSVQN